VGEVADPEGDGHGVEGTVLVGQVECVGPGELDVAQAEPVGLPARELEHRLGEVAAHDAPLRADPATQLQRQVARAAADVERDVAGLELGAFGGPLAPLAVEPRRHGAIHAVVDAGDAVEHPPHLGGELRGLA
jgi:hypothetical protein